VGVDLSYCAVMDSRQPPVSVRGPVRVWRVAMALLVPGWVPAEFVAAVDVMRSDSCVGGDGGAGRGICSAAAQNLVAWVPAAAVAAALATGVLIRWVMGRSPVAASVAAWVVFVGGVAVVMAAIG
jgi:hypothetical protein